MTKCRFANRHGWCDVDDGVTCDGYRKWCEHFASSCFTEVGHITGNEEELWEDCKKVLEDHDEVWVTDVEAQDELQAG